MSDHNKKQRGGKRAADFPALRQFFSGYLHQDFCDEYGSAAGAAQAFREDASDAEVEAVRKEWNAWRTLLDQASSEEIATAVRQLGSAWLPKTTADLDQVEAVLAETRSS